MATDSTPVDSLFPRLLPLALGALIAGLAVATALVPPAPPEAQAATSAGRPAPMAGGETSVPDAAGALRALGDEPVREPPPTF